MICNGQFKAVSRFTLLAGLIAVIALAQPAQQSKQPTPQQGPQRPPSEVVLEPPPILPPTPQSTKPLPILTAPPPHGPGFAGSKGDVIRVLIGLVMLLGLAYLGGLPKAREWQRRLGIAHLVTAGLPFVFLGLIAGLPSIGVLSESVLYELRPLLVLGLGWIGFSIGFRFDSELVKLVWPGAGAVVVLTAAWPFAIALLFCGAMLWAAEGSAGPVVVIRDGIILGTAGAMTASTATDFLQERGVSARSIERIRTIVQLEELAAVIGLLLLGAYFRSLIFTTAWQLPGTAWLFITIGMGATMGAVIYPILNRIEGGPEFVVVMLGSISFTAGMASFLRLSPVVACFIAGVILVNLPGGPKEQVRQTLAHLERPIYLLFLIVAGSLWQVWQWQGWALMGLFVLSRWTGKWIGIAILRKQGIGGLDETEQKSLILSPLGALSIAIVVSAEDLYVSRSIPWIVTAVIGGAIVTEIVAQRSTRGGRGAATPELAAPEVGLS